MINQQNNVCENVCVWDGNTDTWTPPAGYLMLVQATTPAKVWLLVDGVYELVEQMGVGSIGFTWDGSVLTTNEPQPALPQPALDQPVTSGTQTL